MGHEKRVNVLKCTAEESSHQPAVAPHAFCEGGRGSSNWSSGGTIVDILLGATSVEHLEMGDWDFG